MQFLAICLNPVLQHTCILEELREDQVNRAQSARIDASGKGINVTRVLHQLGEPAVHLTQAGGHLRSHFLELVRQDGLHVEWVESHSEIRTCLTLLSRKTHTSTEIVQEAMPVSPVTEGLIRSRFQELLDQVKMIILSGSKAPGFSPELFPWMTAVAVHQKKAVLLDIRGEDLLNCLEQKPDLLKINRTEFTETFFSGRSHPAEEEISDQMLSIARAGSEVILTDGKDPVMATLAGGVQKFAIPELKPVNTIGSGDAFAAGLAADWLGCRDLSSALPKAIWCSRQNAMHLRPGVIR